MTAHRYPGGIINASAPTVTSSSASGVWTVEEAVRYKSAGTWPDGAGTDPYFRNTTLLLHGDGTNGAQNNTFLDSSTNNFTITRNGNTTQGSFDPYVGPGCWSNFYAATSSGWQTPAGSITSILGSTFSSTATFTVEAWIYPLSRHSGGGAVLGYVFGSMNLTGGNADWSFGPDSNGNLVVFWYQGGNQICKSTNLIPLNTWTHIALVVTNGAIKMYINGVQETTTGTSTINLSAPALTYVSSGGYLYAGTTWQGFNGYISNLRVVGKRAVYSANFTPSTTPLVATTDTTLLTNNQNQFGNLSASNYALTVTGGIQVSKFSPFTLYQTNPASYSGYFDGNGDYLSCGSNAALALGAGNFTVECWVYPTSVSIAQNIILDWRSANNSNLSFYLVNAQVNWRIATTNPIAAGTIVANTWTHIAVVRNSGTTTLYINGTSTASFSDANTYGIDDLKVGKAWDANYWNGSLSNIRITKGQALYTTNFTPSTSPLTTTSQGATAANVSLLTCQSTTFIDNSTNAFTITANGNATPKKANPFTDTVTGPTPYAEATYGGSAYFDGTGDYLNTPSSAAFAWGTGDFTVELWFNTQAAFSASRTNIAGTMATGGGLFAPTNTSMNWNSFGVGDIVTAAFVPAVGAWYHLAYSRSGTTGRLFVNGALLVSGTDSTNYTATTFNIGFNAAQYLNAYISNVRVVKGTAVYTTPFVPPTTPLTAITNTQLLLNATNGGIFDNTTVNDLETVGSAQVSTSVVKYGTGSMSFNGTNSYLTARTNPTMALGTGNFTIEYWINATSFSTTPTIIDFRGSANNLGFSDYITTAGQINIWKSTASILSATSNLTTGSWYFIAYVRNNGTLTIYINGVASGSVADTTNWVAPSDVMNIASYKAGTGGYFNGYLDDIRVTLGYARYTTNFTPPTGPFPNI